MTGTQGSGAAWLAMLALAGTLLARPAQASSPDELIRVINSYRTTTQVCNGQRMPPVPALKRHSVLSSVRIGPGTILVAALEQKGYGVAHVEAISVAGPDDAAAVLAAASASYCTALRATRFQHIGVTRQARPGISCWPSRPRRAHPPRRPLRPRWRRRAPCSRPSTRRAPATARAAVPTTLRPGR